MSTTKKSWLYRVPKFWLRLMLLTCSSPRSGFAWAESVLVLTIWSTCGCVCPFIMPVTSTSQSGSIKSQLVDVFKSSGNILSLIDEIDEFGVFEGLVASGATLGKSTSGCANPAWLPSQVNGLMDAEGVSISMAGAVLAPAHEPGLAKGECPTVLFS